MLRKFAARASRSLARRRDSPGQVKSDTPEVVAENLRLVIWDLDETFWRGTLTEGGIEYVQAHHDTVIELAKRGIINSICSRNDHDTIERLLRERGLWDYFVFSSINWSSKGPRLKEIVETSQLRAPTVLFIDDNPMNRAEAKQFVEGIQVYDPSCISSLLDNSLLKGKNDGNLTRLSQYKLLERRTQDMKTADDSNIFLRESGIQVFIDHDIEKNLDRAVELINRTNQLNFTKLRLPEDQELARNELRSLLSQMEIQAGLVRVFDRYGDYGFCGLYVQRRWLHDIKPKLIHFCFSCRTLGMEVETWLYQRLGSPELYVNGEVLTDITNLNKVVDWIQLETMDPSKGGGAQESFRKIPRIFIRGGCEAVAISHYFEVLTDNLVSEFSFQRDGLEVRLDHSQMLRLALEKPDTEGMKSLLNLGYLRSDFDTALLHSSGEDRCVYILGVWAEVNATVFRHTALELQVLVYLSYKIGVHANDLLSLDLESLPEALKKSWVSDALIELQNNYEYEGFMSGEKTRENISSAIKMLPRNSLVFLLGLTEKTMDSEGNLLDSPAHIEINNALKACTNESDHVIFINVDKCIEGVGDRASSNYRFSREVYFRLFTNIRTKIDEWMLSDEIS